jgi:VWFA-related protein
MFSLLVLSAQLYSQQNTAVPNVTASQAADGILTLHTGTHLVVLDLVVTDRKGHAVTGLAKEDFQLFEDGQQQNIKYFEEHAPVDPALVAKQKAAFAAELPPNTFTNYEPLTGSPATVLLLNELSPLSDHDINPLYGRITNVIRNAPPETPFAIYLLDSQLHLIQPITTDRDLLLDAVNKKLAKTHFAPNDNLSLALILARRTAFTTAIRQLAASLEPTPGRKTLFVFTGGLRGSLSSDPIYDNADPPSPELRRYLCSVEDILEQGRISVYRYYPAAGNVQYGLGGCENSNTTLPVLFETNSHYYTVYYTPTNEDWSGAYRKSRVTVRDKDLAINYRPGYFGLPQNAAARHLATAAQLPDSLNSNSLAIAAIPSRDKPDNGASTAFSLSMATPSPAPAVFTVQITPAASPGTGPAAKGASSDSRISDYYKFHDYRDYTLRFTIPASELRLARELKPGLPPERTPYTGRFEVSAVAYVQGHPADVETSKFTVNFDSLADPRIATSSVAAILIIQIPEHGPRILHLTIRDVLSNQSGTLDIPVDKIVLPGSL